MLCWAHRKCKAVAVHELPDAKDKYKCLLADHGPLTSELLPDSTAYYFFWIDGIPGKYYGIFLDNLLYVELNEMTSWERAKELCARIPGHRLAMYKTTTQHDIMMELYFKNPRKGMLINARKTADGKDRVWGDKTKFSSLPKVKLMFIDAGMHRPGYTVFLSRIYGKEKSAGHDRVVCQANPRGVEW
ncbi:hypothetical protein Hamer_G017541 [Homarus americanus]|uniref:C-type lectin domain-containing protein n=1 Tax=Homarus americanus TaxID=6706 RepID=A0A8J5MKA3_HOMAM|nr:hypothetical protein Hamer_G017541 [Homarus americanus]